MTAGATNFPTSLDSTTNLPLAATLAAIELDGDGTDDQKHSNWAGVVGGAAVALETKIGIGASTPGAAGKLLVATSATTSAWQNTGVDIDGGTIDGITSLTVDADLAFTGAQAITTSTGDLTLSPAGALDINVVSAAGFSVTRAAALPMEATFGSVGGIVGLGLTAESELLADDATITLIPDLTSGDCWLLFVTNSTDSTSALFLVASGAVTKLGGGASWEPTDSDTDECVFVSGTTVVLRNRLGAAKYFMAGHFRLQ